MSNFSSLINELPEIKQSRLVASGIGLWLSWEGKPIATISKTLRDYGALLIAEEDDQILWFCSHSDIFKALARLQIWSRVNPIPVCCEAFPMTIIVGYNFDFSVSVAPELSSQKSSLSQGFLTVVHPELNKQVTSIPGLSTEVVGKVEGLAAVDWLSLQADQGLDYENLRKWYFIIKPLGKTGDKEAILGWRDFSAEIIELLRKLGLRYISDVKEGAIFFPLDSFQLLKSFCQEILTLIRDAKESSDKKYWPIIMAAVTQDNLQFASDLPRKVGLDWNRLAPDFPHVRYSDGLILSEWFRMSEVSLRVKNLSLDSWCTLSLREEGEDIGTGTMQVTLPQVLISADGDSCFYCGQTSHKSRECPSKHLAPSFTSVWQQLAAISVVDFSNGFIDLDDKVSMDDFKDSMLAVFDSGKKLQNILSRAVFEINAASQLRMLQVIWRSQGKQWGDDFDELGPREGKFIWEALAQIEAGELDDAESFIRDAQAESPRNYEPHSLLGFWNIERGDFTQAMFHWQEAERTSVSSLHKGYFLYLQARLMEIEGDFKDAMHKYEEASLCSFSWLDPIYRQGVCLVKMGFSGQAMTLFSELIERDPNIFNRILIDPELERGHVQLMSELYERWYDAEQTVKATRSRVDALIDDISKRFEPGHGFYEQAMAELKHLKSLGETQNYVAYSVLIKGVGKFQKILDKEVKLEIKRIDANLLYQADRIRAIQKEASWFPFPKLLMEFNKDFNFCVDKLNWIKLQRLGNADTFHKCLMLLEEVEQRIDTLQKRLATLRIVRDSTLYILMLGRNFIWLELIILGIALVSIPSLMYFTRNVDGNWFLDAIRQQRWEFSKGLVLILSIVCLALAAIKSALSFDKRKRELFEQSDD